MFGTDGVRGRVGVEPITPSTILKLGWAIGKTLDTTGSRGGVLIGKDTRISGYLLESVLEAGLCSAGMDTVLLGPIPTPGIAYLTRNTDARAGIVISGSHNPYQDNGIKIFSSAGDKLNDKAIGGIQRMMDRPLECVGARQLGKASRMADARDRYVEYCRTTIDPGTTLKGLRVVLDCANGAAYDVAPRVLSDLGAELTVMGNAPDGYNINRQCGSTDLRALQSRVLEVGADVGMAFDGDADRVLLVNSKGAPVNGDEILYVLARYRQRTGRAGGGIVGTVLSNIGLEQSLKEAGIPFVRTRVGDRFVQEELVARNWILGGEASGHIICLDKSTTGDGIVCGLEVLAAMCETGKSLKQLCEGMTLYPQHAVNIPIDPGSAESVSDHPVVLDAVSDIQGILGSRGRVVLRPSGTEPLFRVMLEGEDPDQLELLTGRIVEAINRAVSA